MNVVISALRPLPEGYPTELVSVGDHIRKRRFDLGLLQREVAEFCGVCEDTVTGWESGRIPSISIDNWPSVISFLSYYPFPPPTNLSERLKALRLCYGFSLNRLGDELATDVHTLVRYESGVSPKRKSYVGRFCDRLDEYIESCPPPLYQ